MSSETGSPPTPDRLPPAPVRTRPAKTEGELPPSPVKTKTEGDPPPAQTQSEQNPPENTVPAEIPDMLKKLDVAIVAAKHKIGTKTQESEEVVEQETKLQARQRKTEEKKVWGGKPEGEEASKWDQLKQSLKHAIPRWWKYGVHDSGTYAKEKKQAQKAMAESGLQIKTAPYELLRQVRQQAKEQIDTDRSGMTKKEHRKARRKDFYKAALLQEKELDKKEIAVWRELRKTASGQRQDADVQTFIAGHQTLVKSYHDALNGDFQAAEGLAKRVGNEFGDEALRTAIGEKREQNIEMTGPIADFFRQEVVAPMLKEGLANGGTIDPERLLELRTTIQEKFHSKEFVDWRNSLPEDVQAKLDLSMSYGTDIIPAVEKVLLPQVMAMKDHLQSVSDIDTYVKDMVLNVNVGTLKAGEQSGVEESWKEGKMARAITNERVQALYQAIERGEGPEHVVPGAYQDALSAASGRMDILKYVPTGHNLVGVATGVGIYAAQRAITHSASVVLPILGGSAVGGVVRGMQERSRFTRDVEQHAREAARGVTFDKDAKRRNEQKKLEMPMINIQTDVLSPLEQARVQLEAGQVTDAVLNSAFGLLADTRVRREIMDESTSVELYRTTTDQSLDAQKTDLELSRAKTMVELRKYAADNPQAMQAFATKLGITFNAGDSIDSILNPLTQSLQANLQRGTEITNQLQNALTTGVDKKASIDKRESKMKRARIKAQLKQGTATAVAAAGGMLVSHALTQEVFAIGHRGFAAAETAFGGKGSPTQTTDAERFFGAKDVGPATEGFHATKTVDVDPKVLGTDRLKLKIPDGTHLVPHDGKWDLVVNNNPDQVLFKNGYVDSAGTFQYDHAASVTDLKVDHSTATIDKTEKVTGPDGVWAKHSMQTDHREWYGNNTEKSDLNELKGHTIKTGDAITVELQDMGISSQNGLVPPNLDVQQVIKEGHAQIAFTLPGDLNHPIVVNADQFNVHKDGKVWASIKLDPNDNDPTHMYTLGDGSKIQKGELARAMLNVNAYHNIADGDIATEMKIHRPGDGGGPARQLREVFNLGGPDGTQRGQISTGRLTKTADGKDVWQSFATMFGTGKTADVSVPTPQDVFEITGSIASSEEPWEPFGIPIPAPWQRRPLESGKNSIKASETPVYTPINYFDYTDYLSEYAEPQEYPEFDTVGEYGEYGEYKEHKVAKKKDQLELTEGVDKRIEAEERTPEALQNERVKSQEDYIDRLRTKYAINSTNDQVQRMLYRLNGGKKNYIQELEEVNSSLPPMSEKAKLSVVIPAFNEQGKVEQTLEGWAKQIQEANSENIDPENIELLMVLNRPNDSVAFDDTDSLIERLKTDPRFDKLQLHVLKKTFNFPDVEQTITTPNGEILSIPPGKRMGLIYKYGADLAVLRNIARKDKLRVANHLMRTGGADTAGRNPEFVSRVFGWFDSNPYLEQYTSRSDYPPAIYEKLPLLHVAHRLNQMMNFQMTKGNSHIGLGTYRAGAYAESGGFNSAVDVREEIDLSRRLRQVINHREDDGHTARKREAVINALDDPRRATVAIMAGKPITRIYDTWTNDAVRNVNLDDVLQQEIPSEAQLTPENLQKQVQAVYNFYFRQIMLSKQGQGGSRASQIQYAQQTASRFLKNSLGFLGIDDYKLEYNGDILADYGKSNEEIGKNFRVEIGGIKNLQQLSNDYPQRNRPAWINGKEEPKDPLDILGSEANLSLNTREGFFSEANQTLRRSTKPTELLAMTPETFGDILSKEGILFGQDTTFRDIQTTKENGTIVLNGTMQYKNKLIPLTNASFEVQNGTLSLRDLNYDSSQLTLAERTIFRVRAMQAKNLINDRVLDRMTANVQGENPQWEAMNLQFINGMNVAYRKVTDGVTGYADGYRAGEPVPTNPTPRRTIAGRLDPVRRSAQRGAEAVANGIADATQLATGQLDVVQARHEERRRRRAVPVDERVVEKRSGTEQREVRERFESPMPSYGYSSRGGRPDRPDEDSYFSASTGMHLAEIGGTKDQTTDTTYRERTLATALDGLRVRNVNGALEQLTITPEGIARSADVIQNLIGEGKLRGLDVVADGAGGHGSGEYASSITNLMFVSEIASYATAGRVIDADAIRDAVQFANNTLEAYNQAHSQKSGRNAITTLVAQVTNANGETFVASVGDSRAYKQDVDGNVLRLTSDQSLVESFMQSGNLRPSEVFTHPRRSTLLNSVGEGLSRYRILPATLQPGEKLYLVCDGVWEGIGKDQQTQTVLNNVDQTYAQDIQSGMNPTAAQNKAFGAIFQQVNLQGIQQLPSDQLASTLASDRVGQLSRDNVTAVIVEGPVATTENANATQPTSGNESVTVENTAAVSQKEKLMQAEDRARTFLMDLGTIMPDEKEYAVEQAEAFLDTDAVYVFGVEQAERDFENVVTFFMSDARSAGADQATLADMRTRFGTVVNNTAGKYFASQEQDVMTDTILLFMAQHPEAYSTASEQHLNILVQAFVTADAIANN